MNVNVSPVTFDCKLSFYNNRIDTTLVFSWHIICRSLYRYFCLSVEADLWPGGEGAAEEGSGDGAGAVETDHITPANSPSSPS